MRGPAITDAERFAAYWRDLTIRVADIVEAFGVCEATVHATARRLDLPPRADLRADAGLCRQGPFAVDRTDEDRRLAHNQRQREWRRRKRVGGVYLKDDAHRKGDPAEPTPKFRRCPICNGTEDLSAPHRHGEAA